MLKKFTVPLLLKYWDTYKLDDLKDALETMSHGAKMAKEALLPEEEKVLSDMVAKIEARIVELTPAPVVEAPVEEAKVEAPVETPVVEPTPDQQAEALRVGVEKVSKRVRR